MTIYNNRAEEAGSAIMANPLASVYPMMKNILQQTNFSKKSFRKLLSLRQV